MQTPKASLKDISQEVFLYHIYHHLRVSDIQSLCCLCTSFQVPLPNCWSLIMERQFPTAPEILHKHFPKLMEIYQQNIKALYADFVLIFRTVSRSIGLDLKKEPLVPKDQICPFWNRSMDSFKLLIPRIARTISFYEWQGPYAQSIFEAIFELKSGQLVYAIYREVDNSCEVQDWYSYELQASTMERLKESVKAKDDRCAYYMLNTREYKWNILPQFARLRVLTPFEVYSYIFETLQSISTVGIQYFELQHPNPTICLRRKIVAQLKIVDNSRYKNPRHSVTTKEWKKAVIDRIQIVTWVRDNWPRECGYFNDFSPELYFERNGLRVQSLLDVKQDEKLEMRVIRRPKAMKQLEPTAQQPYPGKNERRGRGR